MSYDGMVQVGGPPQSRDLGGLVLTKVAVGPMNNNAYLLRCKETGSQLLVDAADDARTLLPIVTADDRRLGMIVTTHQHADHWQALEDVVTATGAQTAAHVADAPGIPVPTTELLEDGDSLPIGMATVSVIHVVGHTPGSIVVRYDSPDGRSHLFTGDSLFPGGVGNTHGNPAHFQSLINDVSTKVFDVLPDDSWVYPGHGGDTTLGAERPHLSEWRERGW